jgi:hypothetical protein
MTSFFQKSDINVSSKVAPNLYVRQSVNNYNSVIMRRQTRKFIPATNGSYSSSASSYISIKISDHQDYLDAQTAMLHFRAILGTGSGTHRHAFNDNICSVFDRAELYIAGVEVERIEQMSRLMNMLVYNSIGQDFMTSTTSYYAGFWRWKKATKNRLDAFAFDAADAARTIQELAGGTLASSNNYVVECIDVKGAESRGQGRTDNVANTVDLTRTEYCVPLAWIFGFFKTQQFIPIPDTKDIEIRLYLNSYLNASLNLDDGGQADVTWSPYRLQTTKLTDPPASEQLFTLSEIRVLCDMITLHSSYVSAMHDLALSNEGFIMQYSSYSASQELITATSQTFRLSRGVSHLKTALCGIYNNVNYLKGSYTDSNFKGYLNHRFLIGSQTFHTSPVSGLSECYTELLKSFGATGNTNYDTIIEDENMWKNYFFSIAQNFDLTSTEGISNLNTKIPGNDLFLELTLSGTLTTNPDIADPDGLLAGVAGAGAYNPLLVCFVHYDAAVIVRNGQVQVVK